MHSTFTQIRNKINESKMISEKTKVADNEVYVTGTTYIRSYLAYVAHLFEEKQDTIIIKAMGNAIPRAVSLGMLIRGRFKGIHQIAEISTDEIKDRNSVRRVGLIKIILSKKPLDKRHPGYTAPLPDSEVIDYKPFNPSKTFESSKHGERKPIGKQEFRRGGYGRQYEGGYEKRYRNGYGSYYGNKFEGGYRNEIGRASSRERVSAPV